MPSTIAAGWGGLKHDLWRRTVEPLRHVSFFCFFMFSVVGFGALGVWVELINLCVSKPPSDPSALRTAIATFYPAIIAPTCFQIMLGHYLKALKATVFPITTVLLLIAGWLIVDHSLSFCVSFPLGILSSILSLWLWWAANADNPDLADEALTEAPVGGAVDKPLSGDLNGFQS